jgi:hypothetical protein
VIADASVERRARLVELTALSEFLIEWMPKLADEFLALYVSCPCAPSGAPDNTA